MYKTQLMILAVICFLLIPLLNFAEHLNCDNCSGTISLGPAALCREPSVIDHHYGDFSEQRIQNKDSAQTPLIKGVCTCCFSNTLTASAEDTILILKNPLLQDMGISPIVITKNYWNKNLLFSINSSHRAPPFFSDLKKVRLLC